MLKMLYSVSSGLNAAAASVEVSMSAVSSAVAPLASPSLLPVSNSAMTVFTASLSAVKSRSTLSELERVTTATRSAGDICLFA